MSDILKVTTPIINKNQPIMPKNGVDPTNPFTISDPSRVMRTHNQSDLLKQNHGMNQNSDTPVLLMNLLKDPAVAVSYLKNIFLLEEIFKLLPANNKTVTSEIEQIFQALIIKQEDIKGELKKQENASTSFKGPLFDFLREISASEKATPATQYTIATLLKSINNLANKGDILDAVANSLGFLKDNLESNKPISEKLDELISQYRKDSASKNFGNLKQETLQVMKDVENSLLFSPKISKVVSIIIYNLSRYNDSTRFFNEASFRLRHILNTEDQKKFVSLINKLSASIELGTFPIKAEDDADSKVMDALIKLVFKQSGNENLASSEASKIDKILHSLLSSPCNFTPLLHFIIPVVHEDIRAFAEVWINPESDDKDMPGDIKEGKHLLIVIDIDSIGRFEAELFIHGKNVDFSLYCPSGYDEEFEGMMDSLPKILGGLNYKLGQTKVERLDSARSLMQVFKSLPYKRVGVDVKI